MNHAMKFAVAVALAACTMPAAAAPVTLTGTIRDFCAPSIGSACAQLSDFEGAITGVVPNMTTTTLTGGLPTAGPNIGAGASSIANFARWYVDSPGFNLGQPFSVTLSEGPAGVFSFGSSSFFPINGQLFGNQGRSQNYHFTVHLEGLLSFADPNPSTPDYSFGFTGDDDLWIFVDGKQFIDLGGVHGAASAGFNEETLKAAGLLPGTPYDLDIFFAERHTVASNFFVTTSFTIASPPVGIPEPGSLALAGLGLAALFAARRNNPIERRTRG